MRPHQGKDPGAAPDNRQSFVFFPDPVEIQMAETDLGLSIGIQGMRGEEAEMIRKRPHPPRIIMHGFDAVLAPDDIMNQAESPPRGQDDAPAMFPSIGNSPS